MIGNLLDNSLIRAKKCRMSSYAVRASAIHRIAQDLQTQMEITAARGTISDKASVLELGIEVVNKVLHSFSVDHDLAQRVDRDVNEKFTTLQPTPESINDCYFGLMGVVRDFNRTAGQFADQYCKI